MTDPVALSSALIGEIFVERGLITAGQLEEALVAQAETGELLGEILVSRFSVPRVELAGVLAEQWAKMERDETHAEPSRASSVASVPSGQPEVVSGPELDDMERRPIGEIFVEHGTVTQSQLDSALSAQGESGQRLGEVLVAQGAITRLELASALAEQWSTLQKIRPPEPKAAEPWQEAAVRAVGVEPRAEAVPIAPPPADVENLRDAVKALEERLRTVSASSSPSPPDEKLRETTDALAARIEGLEQRIDSVASPDLGELQVTVGGLRASLDELQARLEEPNQSVIDLERRLETAVDGLLARVETLHGVQSSEAASSSEAALTGIRDALAGLQQQTTDLPGRDEVDAIRVALGAVSEQVKELATRGHGVTHDELERRVGAAFDDLRERLDAVEPQQGDDAIAELRGSLASLEARLEAAQSAPAPATSPDFMAELDARVAELREQDANARAELVARLDEELAATASLAQSEEVSALAAQIGELGARVSSLASADQIVALELELTEVRELADARPAAPGNEAVEELQTALADLGTRLREVASRPAGVSQDHLEQRLADVAKAVAEDHQAAGSNDAVVAEVAAIREVIAALEHQVAAVGVTPEMLAGLDAKLQGVGIRVDEVVASVSALGLRGQEELTKDEVDAMLVTERDAREALTARLDELAALWQNGQTDDETHAALADVQRQLAELAALRHQVEALASSGDQSGEIADLRHQLASLADLRDQIGDLPELRSRVSALSGLEHQSGELADLRHEVAALSALRSTVDALPDELNEQRAALADLRQRIETLGVSNGQDAEIAELRQNVAALASLPDRVAALDELRNQVAELAEGPDNSDAVAALERSFAERADTEAASRGSLEAQLGKVKQELLSVDELRDQVQVLAAEHQDTVRRGDLEELRHGLAELGGRLEGLASAEWVASVEQASGAASQSVGDRLDGVEHRLEGLDRTADLEQVHSLVGDLTSRIGSLDSSLAALRTSMDETVSAALGSALEHSVSHDALKQLAADLHGRLAEIEAANAPTIAALDELGMRLGAAEQQAWALPEQLDDRFARSHHELSGRIEGLGAGHDAALAALHARLDELAGATHAEGDRLAGLEVAAASTTVRLEGLEARQAADGAVGDQIAALTARLDSELALAEARGAATERAIRKGLAGLGERLAANEETYLESGAALRRSIERLGAAVVEADTRLADLPLDPPDHGYVAFVPTPDGYRLRPLDGSAPGVGDVLELDEAAGPLRVTRIARSPLPLDRRACAYLEHA